MSIRFKDFNQTLAATIEAAAHNNATYVIPDLQRPFVWSPNQVILLVDSIFKSWPFGTLLLWEVKPDCFNANEGIPNRPFWQVVDRTEDDDGSQSMTTGMPATYQMVLDGQQRIQSLVLALGGDKFGFKLYDSDWAFTMLDKRIKNTDNWSNGVLCIDLDKFSDELLSKNNKVRKIEVGKILDWAVTDIYNGVSPNKVKSPDAYPFLTSEHPGRFIRLSRFWDLTQNQLTVEEYEDILLPFLLSHSVSSTKMNVVLKPLAQFMQIVENIKKNSLVHSLQIESFTVTPHWTKDDYSEAIVNIFTRLNTAGRTLTREEITLAWLKVGWDKSNTNDRPASECLNELIEIFKDANIDLEMDDVVRLISFMWCVSDRGGVLLDSKDLLKGDIIRPMSKVVSLDWSNITETIKAGLEVIKERNLVTVRGSFNAIIVSLTWYRICINQLSKLKPTLNVPQYDSLEKQTLAQIYQFFDRWIFCSQWANVWGDGAVLNFSNFASDISKSRTEINSSNNSNFLQATLNSINKLMDRISTKATDYINTVTVRDRSRVGQYYTVLWIWHRLEEQRWKISSIQLREGRKRNTPLHVDHTVADALWKRKVDSSIAAKLAFFTGTDEEKALLHPDEFETKFQAYEFINLLGNCTLLESSFNISKSDNEMRAFLTNVHEFLNGNFKIADWENALLIEPTMTAPENVALKDVMVSVKKRDLSMRKELIEFTNGTKFRVDC